MCGWRTCWIKVKKVKVKRFWKRIEMERTLNPVKRKSPDFSLASTKLHRTFLASYPFRRASLQKGIHTQLQFYSRAISKCRVSALKY